MEDPITEINAAIGNLARATSSIDLYLTVLLSEVVHPPMVGQDLWLASLMVQSQGRTEGRIDIVRNVIERELAFAFGQPKHTYPYKLAEFVLKAFNKVAAHSTSYVWVRNLASHGIVLTGETCLVSPQMADFTGAENLKRQRAKRGKSPLPANEQGFSATELLHCAGEIRSISQIGNLIPILKSIRLRSFEGEKLEAAVVQLGNDLQLQVPLQVRPHRQAKPKRR